VSFVEANEEKEKIRRLVQRVKETETPGRHGAAFCYSRAVYAAFHEIAALREEKFSLAAICKVMESDGLLPERACPHSFRRAFRRELARRNKAAMTQRGDNQIGGVGRKESAAPPKEVEGRGKNPDYKESVNFRRQCGNDQILGSGVIKKLPDGSFVY
jgi:hypothetical protein